MVMTMTRVPRTVLSEDTGMGFGKTLQALRKRAGLSQVQLAARSGTPLDNLRNWEQERALPRIDSLKRLAVALGVSADELIADVEIERPDEKPVTPMRSKQSKKK